MEKGIKEEQGTLAGLYAGAIMLSRDLKDLAKAAGSGDIEDWELRKVTGKAHDIYKELGAIMSRLGFDSEGKHL